MPIYNTDGNLAALRSYERGIDNQQCKDEFIEKEALIISAKILQQKFVKLNGDKHLYHIEDFMSDMEVDEKMATGEYCTILSTNAEGYEKGLDEKFDVWCKELAEIHIDNEEQPCEY